MSFKSYRNEIISLFVLMALSVLLQFMGASDILDTRIYYSAAEATDYFSKLTDLKFQNYKRIAVVDLLLYIPAYTSLLYFLIRRFCKPQIWPISLIPAAFDVFETTTILLFLTNSLTHFPPWLGYITFLKWFSGTVIGLFIIGKIIKKRVA